MASAQELRHCGNEKFRLAKLAASPANARQLLWSAVDFYQQALRKAAGARSNETSFCWKNCSVMHKELALLEWSFSRQRSLYHIQQCVEAFSQAICHSATWSKSPSGEDWVEAAMKQFTIGLEAVYSLTLGEPTDESLVLKLHVLCQCVCRLGSNCPSFLQVTVAMLVDLANRQMHLAVLLHNQQQYAKAHRFVSEMNFAIEEADRLSCRNRMLRDSYSQELLSLRADQHIQNIIFCSHVELQHGYDFLRNLDSESNRWTDEALLGIDHLRAALNLISSESLDMALEAEICSAIGSVYFKVFHAESIAKKFFNRTLQLVLCFLSEKTHHCRNETWFEAAERGFRDIQRLEAQRSDEERRKELDADGTLQALQKSFDCGLDAFLDLIYSQHPPPSGKSASPKTESEKKRVLTALLHYHPDKVDKANRRHYFLCEEITKLLNNFLPAC